MSYPNRESSKEASLADEPLTRAPGKPSKWSGKWPLFVGGAAVLGLMLCVGLCIATLGSNFLTVVTQKGNVAAVLDEFMKAMANKNAEHAYSLFSSRAKQQVPSSEIESWLEGANFVLFDGYDTLQVRTLNINLVHNTDPSKPQGTVAQVSGSINYAGGYEGSFQAILEKEGDGWMLDHIQVNAPAEKFDNYSQDE
jgi:hypothetical protein